jgi:hypothetical protein
MRSVCVVKELNGDKFLLPNFLFGSKADAFIGNEEECSRRAELARGTTWPERLSIEELGLSEYLSIIGRKGGKTVTEKKRRHLKRLAQRKSKRAAYNKRRRQQRRAVERKAEAKVRAAKRPKKPTGCWWHNERFAVRSRSIGEANRLVRTVHPEVASGELRHSWVRGKPDTYLPEINGVYQLNDDLWQRETE